jgi:lipid A 3-O-deacylase
MWLVAISGVHAAEVETPEPAGEPNALDIIDEVRFGAAGYVSLGGSSEPGPFINGQVLFESIIPPMQNALANALLRPRPHIGLSAGLGDDSTDQIFAVFTWDIPLPSVFFLEASFGATVHNGHLELPPDADRPELGCRLLFHERLGIGAELGQHWRIVAGADHSSNFGFCESNSGLTHAGVSLGYHF